MVKQVPVVSRAAPSWWNDHHTRSWERAKQSLPASEQLEPATRFGYCASSYYSDHVDWNASLEAKLSDDWREVDPTRAWSTVRREVRRGWDHARGASADTPSRHQRLPPTGTGAPPRSARPARAAGHLGGAR